MNHKFCSSHCDHNIIIECHSCFKKFGPPCFQKAIEAMEDNWVSVDEKLPKSNVQCLTYSPELVDGPYRLLTTNNGRFFLDVTHWKPLYQPLKKAKS